MAARRTSEFANVFSVVQLVELGRLSFVVPGVATD